MRDVRRLISIGVSALVCIACTRDPQPRDVTAVSPPQETADPPSAEAPAADSSLAIKRGVMTLDEERVTFRRCGAKPEWWVLDQSSGLQTHTLIEEAHAAPTEIYVEAYGERAAADDAPQAQNLEAVFVLEEILYAGVPGDLRGCDAPDPTYIVTARGNEPFWSIEVRDEDMIWRQADVPAKITFSAPQTQNAEGAVRYSASAAEHQVELMVHAQPCRDSMSGEYFAYTAKAVFDGAEFSGCARVGR